MSEIIFYDLPNKGRGCGSPNAWKTRLLLNYKELPYKTEWVEYPNIAPTFMSFGLPPNERGTPYTIPTIRDVKGQYTMDSRKIADELEKQYPEPSLHLDSPLLPRVEAGVLNMFGPLRPVMLPLIPRTRLNAAAVEYFERTRKEMVGMPLSQWEKEQGGDKAWEKATPAFKEVGDMLRANGGPFILGKTVSYADFVILSGLECAKRIDESFFERSIEIEPALKTLHEASSAWLERDDH